MVTQTRVGIVKEATIERFRTDVRGQVIQPGDTDYEVARKVWNGMIDRFPAVIVRCVGVADVMSAVRLAREEQLPIAVRGGGHNVAGFGTCDGGIVIDLGPMKGVQIDPTRKTVRAQAGLTWGELDHETQALGLATTGGLVTTTGIAGFTLGGGIGWLLRRHGLTSDNLIGADVVTASGEFVTTTGRENDELLWGLRGGGGNFGIVTSFEYQLHPVGPIVYGGAVFYTTDRAAELLQFYREWTRSAPDDLTTMFAFVTAPPQPFIPPSLVGQPVVAVVLCYAGSTESGEAIVAPLRECAPPAADALGPIPYVTLQGMFDAGAPRGIRSYWKTAYFDDFSNDAIAVLVDHAKRMHTLWPSTAVHIHQAGGAVARASDAGSAFGRRSARFILNLPAAWWDPAQDEAHIAWVREAYAALQPFAGDGAYLNFLAADDGGRLRSAYGADRYDRLAALKARMDPENLFRINQNIAPPA
jgi:FAD/FMN-containing dehydrogenase